MGPNVEDECREVEGRIRALPAVAVAALAVGAAQRLMARYLSTSGTAGSAFVAGWSTALSTLWDALALPTPGRKRALEKYLEDYYCGPYCHELGSSALPGADEDAAAAAIYALEAYCNQNKDSGLAAARRLVDAADQAADAQTEASGEDLMSEDAQLRRDRFARREIDRINSAVDVLDSAGVTSASLQGLRGVFAR